MLPNTGPTQDTNRISGERRWFALGAVLVTMFFSSLDQTVVSTAMPVIIGDLKGFAIYAWVFTAYMIASTIMVPIYGKLSDVYGRKPFYIFGLGLFMIGSILSGQSHTMLQLIIFRAFQGIGGGAMMSMPRATIGDIFNPRERGRWMGVIAMTFGLASIVGPFLGGWITDHWGWRWIFYINLPVAAVALGALLYALPRVRIHKKVHIDWVGSITLVAGLIPLLLAFTWAGNQYAWLSAEIIGLFAFSVVMLAVFVWIERRAPEPIIPIEFFRVRVFSTANAVGFLLTIGMFGTLMFLPVFVQGVLGMTAENSGAILTPMMLSVIVGSLVAGQVMTRTGRYKVLTVVAAAIMAGGMFLMSRLRADSTWIMVVRDMAVTGVGIGGLMPTLNVAVQNAFPYEVMGVVNASQQFVRSLGGAIAAPILGTVLANTFASRLQLNLPAALKSAVSGLSAAQRKQFLDPQSLINSQTQAAIKSQFSAFGAQAETLYKGFIDAVHHALASGMAELFLIALGVAVAAFLVTFLLPEISLKHDEFYEMEKAGDSTPAQAASEAQSGTGADEEAEPETAGASAGGGGAYEAGGQQPPRPPRNRKPWVVAGVALTILLALLGLAVHGLLVRNRLSERIDDLSGQVQSVAKAQSEGIAGLGTQLDAVQSAEKSILEDEAALQSRTAAVAVPSVVLLTTSVSGEGTVIPDHGSYREGSTVSLRATAATGWHFAGWSGDASGTANPLRVTMRPSESVSATFVRDTYRISARAGSGGSITPSGAVNAEYGMEKTFVISPAPHEHVVDVTVNGRSVGPVTRYTFAEISADQTIRATFAPEKESLTTSTVGRGSVTPENGTYDYGTKVSLRAMPAAGWHFVAWKGTVSGTANPSTVQMDGPTTATATFAPNTEMIVARAGPGGVVHPSGTVSVGYGAQQTFSISPAAHQHVVDVLVDGHSVGAVASYAFPEVTGNHTLTVAFAPDQETLTTVTQGSGAVTPSKGAYAYGTTVSLRAVADPGWHFVGWSGDASGSSDRVSLKMTGAMSVAATFAVDQETIQASAGENGSVRPGGAVEMTYGADLEFTITPDLGCRVEDVFVDGRSIGPRSTYTFANVTGDHTIRAVFTEPSTEAITADAGKNGTIEPRGAVRVAYGTDQTFTITADAGDHVADVRVDGRSVGPIRSYTFKDVTQSHSIQAMFGHGDMIAISASAGSGGTISPGVAWLAEPGGSVSFEIAPDPGYRVADVRVDGRSIGAVTHYTFHNVATNQTISATFVRKSG